MTNILGNLWSRGTEFLGSKHAIMGGAMSWVSEHHLVAAMSNAGAFGVIANGSMPPELLEKEIIETKKLTDKPFGVNLIIMHPQLDALIDVCKRQNVSHVVLAGGIPGGNSIKAIKDYGAKVIGFAPSAIIGRKLIRLGADALVIEGMEAGGHIEAIYFCPHGPEEGCHCRKPQTGMYEQFAKQFNVDLDGIPAIGDSLKDIQAAQSIGAEAILVETGNGKKTLKRNPELDVPTFVNLHEAVQYILFTQA
jgi:HAD superfamily hydrolase (TIGR01662 family)